jgi:hypothetical protein
MPDTKTIWVIERGSYSDYRVLGVFSCKAHARRVADMINQKEHYGDKATIDEWPLDPCVEELVKGYVQWCVWMERDGRVEKCEPASSWCGDEDGEVWRRSTAPAYAGHGLSDLLTMNVWARDETHAIKIVNEHRAQMIAMGKWRVVKA